jgi:hypothetical protein
LDTVFCRVDRSDWFALSAKALVTDDVVARGEMADAMLVDTSVDFANGTRADVISLDFARPLRDVKGA